MRLRHVKGSREKIQTDNYVIQEPEQYKGKWNTFFGNDNPIHIEIGMGKGKFVQTLASMNPNINYIGIEKFSSVLVRALEKRPELESSNLVFIRMDAENMNDVFGEGEVSQIYLNFSDPWPKERHAKRRLTSVQFLNRYDKLLIKEGLVTFKTDNKELFEFSLEQIDEAGWKLKNKTNDLHHSEFLPGNVMTEYEEKFVSEGKEINRLVAYR
jgi:tRNA (guanine-N7-)-methyltransferase